MDVIVIGGGPSGLMAAAVCASRGKEVMLLEHNAKIGKKLMATGNGKCNYTNDYQEQACYRSQNPAKAFRLVERFNAQAVISRLLSLGIYPRVRNGYYYPYSEEASSVVEAFLLELEKQKVKLKCSEHVERVEPLPSQGGFLVHTKTYAYRCRAVILACGGLAGDKMGNDASGYTIAKALGHTVTDLAPALTGLRVRETYFERLKGIRVKGGIGLFIEGSEAARETGEIQLNAYGVSGIPVLQISRFASMALLRDKRVTVAIDLFPEQEEAEVLHFLEQQKERNGTKTLETALHGLLNKKLLAVLLEEAGLCPAVRLEKLNREQQITLSGQLKHWEFTICGVNGYEHAQATAGGVDLAEAEEETLESKKQKGLYLAGELLDVDGTCGGYNLQWAFTSGYIAGMAAGGNENDTHDTN